MMNFDCVSFIDWLMPLTFWSGFLGGALLGVVAGIIIEWRLIMNILKKEKDGHK